MTDISPELAADYANDDMTLEQIRDKWFDTLGWTWDKHQKMRRKWRLANGLPAPKRGRPTTTSVAPSTTPHAVKAQQYKEDLDARYAAAMVFLNETRPTIRFGSYEDYALSYALGSFPQRP